jgi:hypothetical protein
MSCLLAGVPLAASYALQTRLFEPGAATPSSARQLFRANDAPILGTHDSPRSTLAPFCLAHGAKCVEARVNRPCVRQFLSRV